jgi:preprotein translocase subunit SecA
MTGTAMADAAELEMVYGLKVTPVPTALPVARRDYPDVVFKTRKAANDALIREIAGVIQGGRPCLIGTTSVAQSEVIVAALAEKDISAELLNASPKNAPRESEIIAQAGRTGVVTVATNMAGRGTDILLGGCPTTMARIKTRSFLLNEGLLSQDEATLLPPSPPEEYYPCLITEIDFALLKEAASTIKASYGSSLTGFELDEMLTVATDATEAEDDPETIVKLREAATAVKETFSAVLSQEKEAVKKNGGLYVMGTNRHESSRIDQQLRGRAGRQGDPGSSRFFLSFEDDMFVIFGGEGLKKILDMFRVSEDMPVEAAQVTEALDKVQRAVEDKYREIRKEVFNFDETLNGQRQVIYSRRRNILFATPEKSFQTMKDYNEQTVREIVKAQTGDKGSVNVEKVVTKICQFFPLLTSTVSESEFNGRNAEDITSILISAVDKAFNAKADEVNQKVANSLGRSSNYIILVTMDTAWSDHLQAMENLKESVILRKFEGRDPVAEYRNEAFTLFQGLEDTMRRNAVFSLWQSLATSSQGVAQIA